MFAKIRESAFARGICSFYGMLKESRLREFFMGKWYPPIVCLFVLIGHLFGLEMLSNTLVILTVSLALIIAPTARPLIAPACAYIFQVSVANTPALPAYSDYYFSGWRLPLVIVLFLLVALAIIFFSVKERIFSGINFRRPRLLLPLCVLMLAFAFGGAFSDAWSFSNFAYGVLQAFSFGFFFLIFYCGLRRENFEDISEYFSYVSALIVLLLFSQIGSVYISALCQGVEVIKGEILFGWGVWNSMGAAILMLMPVCFIGVIRSKYSWLYFAAATLALFGAFLTQSRNALLFGFIFYAVCILICCFVGRFKEVYRAIATVGVIAVIAGIIVMWDKIPSHIAGFFDDNGRYTIWQMGIDNFLSSPIFGKGFFGFEFPDDPNYFVGADFLPGFVHQTFIQFLSATGIFGLLSYVFYRLSTVMAVIRRPNVIKTLLFTSVLVLLSMSLIDTFIFNFWPVIHYCASLAIIYIDSDINDTRNRVVEAQKAN